MFVHVVLFWMKPDAPAGAAEQVIADCRALIAPVPGLAFFDVGRPAMTPREVVDNSYHVGLLTVFTDQAAHDAYQTHPEHLKFIERNKPNWERVKIYDFR
jgi:quinol monooxygenase YgiN